MTSILISLLSLGLSACALVIAYRAHRLNIVEHKLKFSPPSFSVEKIYVDSLKNYKLLDISPDSYSPLIIVRINNNSDLKDRFEVFVKSPTKKFIQLGIPDVAIEPADKDELIVFLDPEKATECFKEREKIQVILSSTRFEPIVKQMLMRPFSRY